MNKARTVRKLRSWLSKVAAGWHICLDVAERQLAGDPVGRIVADATPVLVIPADAVTRAAELGH